MSSRVGGQSTSSGRPLKAPSTAMGAPSRPAAVAAKRTTAPRTVSPTVSIRGAMRLQPQPAPRASSSTPAAAAKSFAAAARAVPVAAPAPRAASASNPRRSVSPCAVPVGAMSRESSLSSTATGDSYGYYPAAAAAAQLNAAPSSRAGDSIGGRGGNAPIASDGWMAAVLQSHLPPPVASNVRVITTPVNMDSSLTVGSSRYLSSDTVSRAGSTTVLTIPRLVLVPEETTTFILPAAKDLGAMLGGGRRGTTTPRPFSAGGAGCVGGGEESRVKVMIRDAPATHRHVQQYVAAATSPSTASRRGGFGVGAGVSARGSSARSSSATRSTTPTAFTRSASSAGAPIPTGGTMAVPSMRSLEAAAREAQRDAMRQREYRRAAERDEFKESLDVLMHHNRKLDRAEARRRIREGGLLESVPSPGKSPRSAPIATAARDEYCFLPKVLTPRKVVTRSSRLGTPSRASTPTRPSGGGLTMVPGSSVPSGANTPRNAMSPHRAPSSPLPAGASASGSGAAMVTIPHANTSRTLPFDKEGDEHGVMTDVSVLSRSTDTPSQKLAAMSSLRATNEPLWVQLQRVDPYPPPTHDPAYHRESPIRTRSPSATMPHHHNTTLQHCPSPSPPAARPAVVAPSASTTPSTAAAVVAMTTPSSSAYPACIHAAVQTPRTLTRRVLRDAHTQFEGGAGGGMGMGPRAPPAMSTLDHAPTALVVPHGSVGSVGQVGGGKRAPSSSPSAPLPPPSRSGSAAPTAATSVAASEERVAAQSQHRDEGEGGIGGGRVHLSERLASWGGDAAIMAQLDELSPRRVREREEQQQQMAALVARQEASPEGRRPSQVPHSPVNLRTSPSPTRGATTTAEAMALALSPHNRFNSMCTTTPANLSVISSSSSAAAGYGGGFTHANNYTTPTGVGQSTGYAAGTPSSSCSAGGGGARHLSSPQRSVILEERRLILEKAGIVLPKPVNKRHPSTTYCDEEGHLGPQHHGTPTEVIQKKLKLLGLPPDTVSKNAPSPTRPIAPEAATLETAGATDVSADVTLAVVVPPPVDVSSRVASPPSSPTRAAAGTDSPLWVPSDGSSSDGDGDDACMRSSHSSPHLAPATASASPCVSNAHAAHATVRALGERVVPLVGMAEPEGRAMVVTEESTARNHLLINYTVDTEAHAEAAAAATQRRLQQEAQAAEWRQHHLEKELQVVAAKEAALRFGDEQHEAEVRRVLYSRYMQQHNTVKRIHEREGRTRAVVLDCEECERHDLTVAFEQGLAVLSPAKGGGADGGEAGSSASPIANSRLGTGASPLSHASSSPSRCLSEAFASPHKEGSTTTPPLAPADTSSVSTLHELSGISIDGGSPSNNASNGAGATGSERALSVGASPIAVLEVGGAVAIAAVTDEPAVARYLAWLRAPAAGPFLASSRASLADTLADATKAADAFGSYTHEVIMQEVCDDFGAWFGEGLVAEGGGGGGLFGGPVAPRSLQQRRYPHLPIGTIDGVLDCFALQGAMAGHNAASLSAVEGGDSSTASPIVCGAARFEPSSSFAVAEGDVVVNTVLTRCIKSFISTMVADALAQREEASRIAEEEAQSEARSRRQSPGATPPSGTSPASRSLHPSECSISHSPNRRRLSL